MMMNEELKRVSEPEITLSDMAQNTSSLLEDTICDINQIRTFLFGVTNTEPTKEEPLPKPSCLVDELKLQNRQAKELRELIAKLKKQMEYTWHNASEELPNDGEEVIVKGHGRDYIFPKQGETLKEAVERISKEEWKRVAFYSEEDKCWCGDFGMPLNPQPEEWKPIDWS